MGEALLTRAGSSIGNKSSINNYTYSEEVLLYSYSGSAGSSNGTTVDGVLSDSLTNYVGLKLELSGSGYSTIYSGTTANFNLSIDGTTLKQVAYTFPSGSSYKEFSVSGECIFLSRSNDFTVVLDKTNDTSAELVVRNSNLQSTNINFYIPGTIVVSFEINIYGLK